jgi:dihydroxy-acid dehydratase
MRWERLQSSHNCSQQRRRPAKVEECRKVGRAMRTILELDLKPSQIMTKRAFENAFRTVIVLGGSTNGILHLLAMAHAARVEMTLNDFRRLSEETPVLVDLHPSGK